MSQTSVSIHPYFKVHPRQMETALALLPKFVERTFSEGGCEHYEFTVNGDEIFCRESYKSGEDVLAHLSNVNDLLETMLQHSALIRLEFHGPESELEKLKGPLAALKPTWFACACGLER